MADLPAKKSPILEKAAELEKQKPEKATNRDIIATAAKAEKLPADKFYDPKDAALPSDKRREMSVTKENARYVYMGESQVIKASDDQHILGTNGLHMCVGIAAHNPTTGATGLTHIYLSNSTTSIAQMLDEVAQGATKDKPVEVHLAGGRGKDNEKLADTIRLIESDPRFKIKSQMVGISGDLGINAKTGQVTTRPEVNQDRFDFGTRMKDAKTKEKILGFELLDRFYKNPKEDTPLLRLPEDQFLKPVEKKQPEKSKGQGTEKNMSSLLQGLNSMAAMNVTLADANPAFDATGPAPITGGAPTRPATFRS